MRNFQELQKQTIHYNSPGALEEMSKPKNVRANAKKAFKRNPYAGTIAEIETGGKEHERINREDTKQN